MAQDICRIWSHWSSLYNPSFESINLAIETFLGECHLEQKFDLQSNRIFASCNSLALSFEIAFIFIFCPASWFIVCCENTSILVL